MNTLEIKSQIVSVLTSVEFVQMLSDRCMSNVVLRDKRTDRFIVLETVKVFAAKKTPSKTELQNAWRSMFFHTWKAKFIIEDTANKDLKCGNIFRNLDRFDVLMYFAGELVFDTARFNLDLVEGRVGLTTKSKTRENFATNKDLKAHCYKMADSAWKMLNIDELVLKSLVEAKDEPAEKAQSGEKVEKPDMASVVEAVTETAAEVQKQTTKAA